MDDGIADARGGIVKVKKRIDCPNGRATIVPSVAVKSTVPPMAQPACAKPYPHALNVVMLNHRANAPLQRSIRGLRVMRKPEPT